MRRYVLLYGTISGLLLAIYLAVFTAIPPKPSDNHELAMVWGYLFMLLCLSFVYPGVRSYKQKSLGGTISFGKAFLCGSLITLVAACFYVVAWEIYVNTFASGWLDQYLACMVESAKDKGLSGDALAAHMASMESDFALYKTNMLVRMGVTFSEIVPAALVASLVVALLLRTRKSDNR